MGLVIKRKGTGGSGTTGLILVTNATVITNITTAANWTNDVYTGSLVGLVAWNYYSTATYSYIYDGVLLVRNINKFTTQNTLTKDPTGFFDQNSVIVTYSQTDRTITLTGTVQAYWRGLLVPALVSGWVSDPHPISKTVNQYLYYNGSAFVWSDNIWSFDMLQIAATVYLGATIGHIGLRECHGMALPYDSHRIDHFNIGTFLVSGGASSGITLNSTTAAQRRPITSECVISDEDLQSTLLQKLAGTYSHHFLSGASTAPVSNVSINNAEIVPVLAANPYYNIISGGNWIQTLMPNNGYMSIYRLDMPVTADAESQALRFVFVQGQNVNIGGNSAANARALAAQLALDPSALNLTGLVSPEYRLAYQYVIKYTASNWIIVGEQFVSGTKSKPVNIAAASGITSVSHDISLLGNGTPSDLLSINSTNQSSTLTVVGWTALSQSITITDLTTTDDVWISPADSASATEMSNCGVWCTTQAADSITFTTVNLPTIAINLLIKIQKKA